MVFNIIPFLIIIISLIIIIYIIGKKIPELRILDIHTIIEEKEQSVKKKILETKWKRAIDGAKSFMAKVLSPIIGNFLHSVRALYKKVLDLEKKYSRLAQEKKDLVLNSRERLDKYLYEARQKKNGGAFQEAEESYIKALEIDDRNIDAYQGLSEIYLENKDYVKAKETLSFIIKLLGSVKQDDTNTHIHTLATSYVLLAQVEQNLGNSDNAIKSYKKAVNTEPNNPRLLDLLLNFSIIVKDKKLAFRTLKQLKKSNPENQKIDEYEKQIMSLF